MGPRSALGLAGAAIARRNRISVRASFRVPQEGANALVQLRADDVLEFAGLGMRLGIVDRKGVLKEAFGQAVTAHHVASALAAHGRQLYFSVLHLHQMKVGHAREHPRGGLLTHNRQTPRGACGVEVLRLRRLPFFAANPDLFEQMIDADFVIRRDWRTAVCGIRERTGHRMIRAVLRRVKVQMAVSQLDAPISLYEVHLGSWRRVPETGDFLCYRDLAAQLVEYCTTMGYTHVELSELMGVPLGTVKGRMRIGLQKMRRALERSR